MVAVVLTECALGILHMVDLRLACGSLETLHLAGQGLADGAL